MLKQDSSVAVPEQQLFKMMRLRPENTDVPDRPAVDDQLPMDPPMAVAYDEEAQVTFENNNHRAADNQRSTNVPIEQHIAMVEQNEFLKEQLQRVKERINDYQDMLRSFKELQDELHLREQELEEKESEVVGLTTTIKGYEKRKANLEFEVTKLHKVVHQYKQEQQKLEREVDHLVGQLKAREREFVDANARHSHELGLAAEDKEAVNEQFEAVKDETKKLVAKINQISLQKESKLTNEIDSYRKSYEESKEKLGLANIRIAELEEENRKLQSSLGINRTEMERAVMSMKLENERIQADMRLAKQREMNDQVSKLKGQIERRERDIQKMTSSMTAKQLELKGLHEQFERFRQKEQQGNKKIIDDLERKLARKDEQIELVKEQVQQRDDQISQRQLENDEMSSKVQSLQRNLREVYQQSTQLEGKLMDQSREKASLTSQNGQLKYEIKSLKDIMQHYEGKVKGFGQEESMYMSEIKEHKIKIENLNEIVRQNDKTIRQLNNTVEDLTEKESRLANQCRQLKQLLLESTMNLEKGKHQLERQTRFIDSYKAESDKVKENTEKKWRELKRLYEGQLESMEQRLRAAEAREKSLLVQLDQTDRQCKEYEFELTMSTDIKDVDYRN